MRRLIAREAAQLERREAQASRGVLGRQSTIKQDTDFIEDPVMQRALAPELPTCGAQRHSWPDARCPGCAVSVIMPLHYIRHARGLSRLVLAVALWTMQRPPLARSRVLFVLDEFPALGRVRRVVVRALRSCASTMSACGR